MKKTHRWAVAARAIFGCAIAGLLIYFYAVPQSRQEKAPPAAPAQLNPRQLRFAAGAPQLDYLKIAPVEVLPEPLLDPLGARIVYDENHTARISSPVSGRVTRLLVQPGDRVVAGQPLAWLDSPDYAAAAADFSKANADLQQKQKAYARAAELYQGGAIARKDQEAAENDLRQAEAEDTRAKLHLHNLNPSLKSEVVADYVVRSPLSGIVVERNINPGMEVHPDAANPLYVISDPTHLWVMVDLPERSLAALRVGQDVTVEVDAYPQQRFPARVATIGEAVDPASRRVQVRCVLDNPQRLLKPEMYAQVTPLADTRVKLPRVPNSALVTEGLYSFVFVEKEPGVFEKRQVTLALQGRTESYVKQGLTENERVVTAGALLLNSELSGDN